MKITIHKGCLDIPEDLSFEIEKTSPIFSDQGEQSMPVTLPATEHNLSLLDQPLRVAGRRRYVTTVPAQFQSGVFERSGKLILSTFSRKGLSASLAFSESVIYSDYKDTTLKELFKDVIRSDYSTPWDWADYLIKVYRGAIKDNDFTIFPVFTEKSDDSFLILNEPDPDAPMAYPSLIYMARTVKVGSDEEKVPEGYGLTPFLYLRRLVAMFFDIMGYNICKNAFDDSFFDTVVVLNNNADSICGDALHYADLVPSCTVAEWLEWMEMKFGIYMSIRADGKTVDLMALKDIYNRPADMRISSQNSEDAEEVSIDEPAGLVISSATSIDGAAPAAATLSELAERYGACIRMTDEQFRQWKAYLPGTLKQGTLIYRKTTGEYYETQVDGDGTLTINRIGTDYFSWDMADIEQKQDRTAADELPPLCDCICGADDNVVTALYIGNRLHSRTFVVGGDNEENNQDIIIATDAGLSAITYGHALNYRFGTIRGRDNQGYLLPDVPDLRPEALYEIFFTMEDYISRNGAVTVKLAPELSVAEILSFDMFRPKWWNGLRLLPKTLNYTAGKSLRVSSAEFLALKEYSDPIPLLPRKEIPDLQYYWRYVTDEQGAMDNWYKEFIAENPQLEPYIDGPFWIRFSEPQKTDYAWLAYPEEGGLKKYHHKRSGYFNYINKYNYRSVVRVDCEVDCWYESALLTL